MPVVKMKKILVLGHKSHKELILKKLHEEGIIEIKGSSSGKNTADSDDTGDFDSKIAELSSVIALIESYADIKKSFLESFSPTKEKIEKEELFSIIREFDWESESKKAKSIEGQISNIKNSQAKMLSELAYLSNWESFDVKMSVLYNLEYSAVILGQIKEKDFIALKSKNIGLCEMTEVSKRQNIINTALIIKKESKDEILDILSKTSFSQVFLPNADRTPKEEISKIKKAMEESIQEKESLSQKIKAMAKYLPKLYKTYDYYSVIKQEREANKHFADSDYTFSVAGWIKAKNFIPLKETLKKITPESDIIEIPQDDGEIVPTAIENPPIFRPFEVITKIFGVPGYREVDPTQALSFFYISFFAICLSDAAYGVILAGFAFYLMKKMQLTEGGKNLLLLLFWGGILSIFAGMITGSYFAMDLEAMPKNQLTSFLLSIKIIDPIKQPLNMLIISLMIGVVQILYGLFVGMYWKLKEKEYLTGILDYGLWIFFLSSLVFLLVSSFVYTQYTGLASNLSIAGAVLLVLTQGRNEPTLIKKAISGILSLYRTTSFLGDTLSYSRLLALMMTTGIIGMVINIIALLTKDSVPVLGYVIMFAVLAIGHIFNLVISVLGAFVHSMRLQLVEFFGKFYEGSGKDFKPLRQETKYVIIK